MGCSGMMVLVLLRGAGESDLAGLASSERALLATLPAAPSANLQHPKVQLIGGDEPQLQPRPEAAVPCMHTALTRSRMPQGPVLPN